MRRSTRRLLMFTASIPLIVVAFGIIYQQGMLHLEGQSRSLGASISWAAETITTTGYGSDNEWHHPFMQVFVVVVQFLGVFLVFLVFPVFLLPFFEERFEGRLPKVLPALDDHVVIYRWGPAVTTLVDELRELGVAVVVFEEEPAVARRLHGRGLNVVLASVEDDDPDLSSLVRARGVVTNGTDYDNAVFTMVARQQGFEGPIVSMVESPKRRSAMSRVGATAVFTPRHALAATIAAKASAKITPRVSGAPMLGDQVFVGEVRISGDSELCGKTLANSGIGRQTGATVIGKWVDGDLIEATPNTQLERGAILVAAGDHDSMEALANLSTPVPSGPFLVCGYGDTGRKVTEFLSDAGEEVVIIDLKALDGVTHVGDALDPDLLEQAGARDAQAVILTLEHDSETVFAAAVLRDLAPDVVIIAAADSSKNLPRMRRAGADFGFSVDQVAGQLMRFQLIGEESMSVQRKVKIVRVPAGQLAGEKLLSSNIRERSGCSIIAVERKQQLTANWDESFRIEEADRLYIAGTQEAVALYKEMFGPR